MQGSLVSIIMPCHNGVSYILDAIKSVQNQTYTNWELIIIDDCSTDDSVKTISSFIEKDNRIKLLCTEKSTGFPASVRNLGIQAASGRYIAFLDCDDLWLPAKLEHQLPLFDREDVAVVFSWYLKMNEDGVQHKTPVKSPPFVTYKKLLGGNDIGNLTGIYDTSKVGKVFQKQIHHEDYLMWLELLQSGYIAYNTNTVEAVYRESKHSLSGNKSRALLWTWNIFYKELHLPRIIAFWYLLQYTIKALLKFIK